jgi:hypothetical protein
MASQETLGAAVEQPNMHKVSDLVAYQGPGTSYSGQTVGPLQSTGLVDTASVTGGTASVFSVFDSFTVISIGLSFAGGLGHITEPSSPPEVTPAAGAAETQTAAGFNLGLGAGCPSRSGALLLGSATNGALAGLLPANPAAGTNVPAGQRVNLVNVRWFAQISTNVVSQSAWSQQPVWSTAHAAVNSPANSEHSAFLPGTDSGASDLRNVEWEVLDSVLDALASDPEMRDGARKVRGVRGTIKVSNLPLGGLADPAVPTDPMPRQNRTPESAGARMWLADILLAAGFCGSGARMLAAGNRRSKSLSVKRGFLKFGPRGL